LITPVEIITREEAGLSNDAIWRRIQSGKWQEPFPGVYLTTSGPLTWKKRALAAYKWAGPDALISGRAAGRLYGFPGLDKAPVELITVRDVRSCQPDVAVHRVPSIPKGTRTMIGKIPVTTPTETILDLAAVVDDGPLRAVIQYAIRNEFTTWHKIMAAIEASPRGRRGMAKLRRIMKEGLDSHLEWLLRRVLAKSTLPTPAVHLKVSGGNGTSYEIDFAYAGDRVAIEADGWAFHSDPAAFQRDRVRWRELAKMGWLVLCFTYEDIKFHPEEVVGTIATALRNARGITS
jgi:very-short-patch-repair endonuclease